MTQDQFIEKATNGFEMIKRLHPKATYSISINRDGLESIPILKTLLRDYTPSTLGQDLTHLFATEPSEVEVGLYGSRTHSHLLDQYKYNKLKLPEYVSDSSLGSIVGGTEPKTYKEIYNQIKKDFEFERLQQENATLKEELSSLESKHAGLSGVELEKADLLSENATLKADLEKAQSYTQMLGEGLKIGLSALVNSNPEVVRRITGISPQVLALFKGGAHEKDQGDQSMIAPVQGKKGQLIDRVVMELDDLDADRLELLIPEMLTLKQQILSL